MKSGKSILKGFRHLLTTDKSNWKVVALCVLGATTFWFFNALNKDYATRINYPVEFIFDEEDVVVVEELPEKVSLVVSGGGWNLLRKTLWFNTSPIQILLENPTSQKFITKASLASIISDQLNEVRLNYVVTDTLYLSIEEREYKKVAIIIDSAGITLEKGFRIVSPVEVEPDSALFTGPSSFIGQLADSFLLPVPYKQLDKSFDNVIDLSELESDKIQMEPDQIHVRFNVAHFTRATKDIPILPVNFPADSSVFLRDTTATVTFLVQDDLLDEAEAADFRLIADYRRLNPQDSTVTLTVGEVPDIINDLELGAEKVSLQYARQNRDE